MIKKQSLEVKEIVFCPLTTYCVRGCPAKVIRWIVKTKNDCLTAQFQKCCYVILFENDKNYIVPPYTITLLSLQFWLLLIYYYHYNKFFVFLCVKLCTKHVSHWYTKVIQLEQCVFFKLLLVLISPTTRGTRWY